MTLENKQTASSTLTQLTPGIISCIICMQFAFGWHHALQWHNLWATMVRFDVYQCFTSVAPLTLTPHPPLHPCRLDGGYSMGTLRVSEERPRQAQEGQARSTSSVLPLAESPSGRVVAEGPKPGQHLSHSLSLNKSSPSVALRVQVCSLRCCSVTHDCSTSCCTCTFSMHVAMPMQAPSQQKNMQCTAHGSICKP